MSKWMGFITTLLIVFTHAAAWADCPQPIILHGDMAAKTARNENMNGHVLVRVAFSQEVKTKTASRASRFTSSNAQTIELGFSYPGRINLYDHSGYNFLALRYPPEHFDNLFQWQRASSYRTDIKNSCNLLVDGQYYNTILYVAGSMVYPSIRYPFITLSHKQQFRDSH